jgi:hypothetical protein
MRFNRPSGLAISGDTLFVSDQSSNRVLRVSVSTGVVTSVLGLASYLSAPIGLEGLPGVAPLSQPAGLVLDGAGNLLVSDTSSCRLRRAVERCN